MAYFKKMEMKEEMGRAEWLWGERERVKALESVKEDVR